MKFERIARQFRNSMFGVLMLTSAWPSSALAQDHSHPSIAGAQDQTAAQKKQANALVQMVREATAPFRFLDNPGPDYVLTFGCVSGSDFGAMGMHFVNGPLLGDGEVNVWHPEILLYEPLPNGKIRLTGADYVVLKSDWEANPEHKGPPELMGQLFHLFDSPNRFGLPAFYTLHVWAWKENPNGAFTNWNPNVSCDAFAGENN